MYAIFSIEKSFGFGSTSNKVNREHGDNKRNTWPRNITMRVITIATATALMVSIALSTPAAIATPITFTNIKDATSGHEPSLYSVLGEVAPEYNWVNTDYLNSGAGGRRVNDIDDMMWYSTGREISITMLATYWGGNALPGDSLGQEVVYDLDSSDGRNIFFPTPRVDSSGQTSTIQLTQALTEIVFGDESARPTAWTDSRANSPFANGVLDRVVSFDVQGWISTPGAAAAFNLSRKKPTKAPSSSPSIQEATRIIRICWCL